MNRISSREEALFSDVLAQPTAERGAFLAKACGADVVLGRLAALVAAHEGTDSLLAGAPVEFPAVNEEKPGDLIGRYKLLQKIGEGGCRVVWMAEQEEPVRRRIAFKVIKLGHGLSFSPDGKLIAAASGMGYVRIWDATTFREVATLGGFLMAANNPTFFTGRQPACDIRWRSRSDEAMGCRKSRERPHATRCRRELIQFDLFTRPKPPERHGGRRALDVEPLARAVVGGDCSGGKRSSSEGGKAMNVQRSREEELFAQPLDGAECCAWCARRVMRRLHAAFPPLIAISRSISDILIYQPTSLHPMPNVIRRLAPWNMTPARLPATPSGPCPQPP